MFELSFDGAFAVVRVEIQTNLGIFTNFRIFALYRLQLLVQKRSSYIIHDCLLFLKRSIDEH